MKLNGALAILAVPCLAAMAACGGGSGTAGNQNGNGNDGPCDPDTTGPCYTGPAGTEGMGICAAGVRTCDASGVWGRCLGEVLPVPEDCNTPEDDDCDGQVNEAEDGCGCTPGETADCYTGPAGTEGVGICTAGVTTCNTEGTAFGPCDGEVLPAAETCNTPEDDDCDGLVNEEGPGCLCVPGSTQPCYTGPAGTEGVGVCTGGLQTCDATGTGYGPCVGEVLPSQEVCATMEDDDCDGQANEDGPDCMCVPGSVAPCYNGPAGTDGVGTCVGGTQTCNAQGTGYGFCVGEMLPTAEQCDGMDHDCDGIPDNPPDVDGDGWNACQGDCCETTVQCSEPALVNPGAYEFIGNGVDDDCDPTTSDTAPPAACSTGADFAVTAEGMARAMDICQTTTPTSPKWGLISAEFLTPAGTVPAAAQLDSMRNLQSAVLTNYGTVITPQNGPTMAAISSGIMRDENDAGYAGVMSVLGYYQQPPASYLAAHGGALPASAGCSGTCPSGAGANDGVNLRLTIRVPTNALSLSYQFRFFSYEYWTYSCTAYNDFYLALYQSGAAGLPADGNISFDSMNNPVSVNNGFFEVCSPKSCYTCPSGVAELAGTGMCPTSPCTGGGTVWLQTTAPVVPGEIITLDLMIFDVSDGTLDSLSLLDDFQFSINPSGVGTNPG